MAAAADEALFRIAIAFGYVAAALMLAAVWRTPAPYGRHRGKEGSLGGGRGGIPARLSWALMESPVLFLTPIFFSAGRHSGRAAPRAALLFFVAHYAHRVLIYPLRISGGGRVPPSVFVSAVAFNVYNAYIQGRSLAEFEPLADGWLGETPFWAAAAVFAAGMGINIWADSVLMGLRKGGGGGGSRYSIPRGGLFELVTCPNYMGEIMEWAAWAAMTRSRAGFLFTLLTAANLGPRAMAHHRWYRETFGASYPKKRKALLPFLL